MKINKNFLMAAQLFAAIGAGSITVFKGKEYLHEYLTKQVPVISVHGEMTQGIDGSGRTIVIKMPVVKPRDCRLVDAGRLSGAVRQDTALTQFVFMEPVLRIRPAEYPQTKRFEFRIPDGYNTSKQGILMLDLQYSCKKGNESTYLDVPVRALLNQEKSHILIMKQSREFNEKGSWKKGGQ